ncbi:hypothetical protein [Desulfobacula sp.]|uniref:hypothetical protein n=1 Tax=Desulfobacula sp. TaxID=2593537 RepID=UPI002632CB5D|nr:hypothetical protein [Desulfobacula sp.]
MHSTTDLMVEIRKNESPVISDIEKIEIEIDNLPLDAAGIIEPKTLHEARFSIYFLAALALTEGKVTVENFTEKKVLDPELVVLRRKIKATGLSDIGLSSNVAIHMKDGKIYRRYTPDPKGSLEKPLSPEELKDKFRTTSGLPSETADKVIEKIMGLERIKSTNEILSLV